jgi:hypothetical protein
MSTFGFGHRESRQIVIERDGELWLAAAPAAVGGFLPMGVSSLPGTLRVDPLANGEPEKYTYEATESLLELTTASGAKFQLAIDSGASALRIEGSSAIRLDGVATASFGTSTILREGIKLSVGAINYLFVVKHGKWKFDDTWLLNQFHSVTPVLEVTPDGGRVEIAVYDLPADTPIPALNGTLSDCAAANAADFAKFRDSLLDIPGEWRDVRDRAAFLLWLCHRRRDDGAEFIVRNKYNDAFSSAQMMAIASMAFKDEAKALSLLLANPVSSPPIAGAAVAAMLERGMLNDARGTIYQVYSLLDDAARFWINERTVEKDGLSFYAYRFESGAPTSPEFFTVGEPVFAPDLNSYLILISEVLGKLALLEYDDGEGHKWEERSKSLLRMMFGELWNGEDFVGKNPYTGEQSEADPFLSLVPIVLGGRSPAGMAARIGDKMTLDKVKSPEGLLLVAGLFDAGAVSKAKEMTGKALESVRAEGIGDPFYGASLIALAAKTLM